MKNRFSPIPADENVARCETAYPSVPPSDAAIGVALLRSMTIPISQATPKVAAANTTSVGMRGQSVIESGDWLVTMAPSYLAYWVTVSAASRSQPGQMPTNNVNTAADTIARPVEMGTGSASVDSSPASSQVLTMIRR